MEAKVQDDILNWEVTIMDENDGEAIDPRVKDQLEYLNSCTDEINSLELQLDEANATFRHTLSEYSQVLKQLARKLGKCVQIARPYYEAEEAAQKAKLECEEAAIRYHRACSIHKEARETIALTEEKFNAKQDEYEFNAAWQEMLNRETKKLVNAETLKVESEKEHERTTHIFADAVQHVKVLEQKLKKDISKSRIYFEQKKVFLRVLQDLKSRVESLQKAVSDSKTSYAGCLRKLEMISKEIHDRRKTQLPPREPGVGAEVEVPLYSDLSIYAPLGDLRLTDTESEQTDSLSSTIECEIPEDLKEMCAEAFGSVSPNSPQQKIKSSLQMKCESCLQKPNQSTDISECSNIKVDSANTDKLKECINSAIQPLSNPSNSDIFEEIDLCHD